MRVMVYGLFYDTPKIIRAKTDLSYSNGAIVTVFLRQGKNEELLFLSLLCHFRLTAPILLFRCSKIIYFY